MTTQNLMLAMALKGVAISLFAVVRDAIQKKGAERATAKGRVSTDEVAQGRRLLTIPGSEQTTRDPLDARRIR